MIRVRFGPKRGGVIVEMTEQEARGLRDYLSATLLREEPLTSVLQPEAKPQVYPDSYSEGVARAAMAVEAARRAGKQ